MASKQPGSLRDLYAPPSTAWTFNTGPTNSSDITPSAQPSYQWSTRSSQHPLLNLSPSADEGGLDLPAAIQGLVMAALMKYATNAVALPWEVGKTLLQVQWVPRDGEPSESSSVEPQEQDEDEALSESDNEQDSYFADPLNDDPSTRPIPRITDENGYVIRQSVMDEASIPIYTIPVGSAAGASGMMFRLKNFEPEGWLSLWKGLLTTTISDIMSDSLQPVVRSALETIISPSLPPLGSPFAVYNPPLLISVASQVLTGIILSPLDLIRTRLIVQSADARYRTYRGPLDAFDKILEHEGGLHGVYFHPHLFLPAVIDCTLRSVMPFAVPALMASYLGISHETHPFARNVVEIVGNCASLLVTLPFETIRRRLQVQTRGSMHPLKGCVELRPAPYNGIVDAFWHILTEERSDLPLRPKRRRRRKSLGKETDGQQANTEQTDEGSSWLRHTGIGQLYRGLSLRIGASVFVFFLSMVVGEGEPDVGWAEL